MDIISKDLYVGAGKHRISGWMHADAYPFPGIDAVFDATKAWPFADNTFERIYTQDFMEHIAPQFSVFVINEMHRVLVPNGTMEHYIPNAGSRNDFGSPSHLSHWNLQVFEHFDIKSYRHELDKDYEGIQGAWEKVFAELVNFKVEDDNINRAQSIHVRYKTVK